MIYVKISFIFVFSLFLCFSDIILSDALILPHIAASDTAIYDVTI